MVSNLDLLPADKPEPINNIPSKTKEEGEIRDCGQNGKSEERVMADKTVTN